MVAYEKQVFISYAWKDERERIANAIDQALQAQGIQLVRDKRDLGYKGSIREFMERIGRGACVIVVISDKYLRSKNCMFELLEIAENQDLRERIFPVVLGDADIYNPVRRIQYVKYWEDKIAELDQAMKSVSSANLHGFREEIDLYDRVRDHIARLTDIIQDMNTLTPEMHEEAGFDQLVQALSERMQEIGMPSANTVITTAPADLQARPSTQSARPGGPATMETEDSEPTPPADEPAATKPEAPRQTSTPPSSGPSVAGADGFIKKAVMRLRRDGYQIDKQTRRGGLILRAAAHKSEGKLLLINQHWFVFLEQPALTLDGYTTLEDQLHTYANELCHAENAEYYVMAIIAVEHLSDELIETLATLEPLKPRSKWPYKYVLSLVVYSLERAEVYYNNVDWEDDPGKFGDKIEKYLLS